MSVGNAFEAIEGLHSKWQPHDGQWPILDAVFIEQIKSIFIRCGRKWGKTEIALYLLWRIAKEHPNSPCYFFAPEQKQARNLIWEDPRIKNFGPRHWLLPGSRGINESEMVMRLTNGSFIKIDGTDNHDKYRGVRYKISVYDEYKDANARMRKAMRPNASVLDGIDVYMGSPPDVSGTDYELLEREHKIDKRKLMVHAPSWHNPHISKKWLFDEKTSLYLRGEGDEWEREYAAKYVRGGANSIFPMLDVRMMINHDKLIKERIYRDRKKLQWFWWADPAGATCFAVLFVAINPYTKEIFCLDEIYEKDQKEMTVKNIGKRIIEKRDELFSRMNEWRQGYDEAATWFSNEWMDTFPDENGLEPSQKAHHDKAYGLSLIKTAMLQQKFWVSSRCVNLYKELENYIKDKNGNIPKKNDHLIDDLRYILGAANYEIKTQTEYKEEFNEDFRGEPLEFVDDDEYGHY